MGLYYFQYQALQIVGFGDGEKNGVVLALGAALQHAEGAAGIERGFRHHFEQHGFAHVVRARAGDQHAAGREQTQGAQVDLLVTGGRRLEVAPRFREGRRIEHHDRELAAGGSVAGQQLERVRVAELDVGDGVGRGIDARGGQRRFGTVDGLDRLAPGGEVEREATGGGEAVERAAAR